MSKGNPVVRVRAPQDQIDRWKAAAAAANKDLPVWIREALDRASKGNR